MDQLCIVALALAAAMPQSSVLPIEEFPPPGSTCTEISPNSPLLDDCIRAWEEIEPRESTICPTIFLTQHVFKTVGTCTVHTYSELGKAHCLNRDDIGEGILKILVPCSNTKFTGGSWTWTPEGQPREGVKLVRSAA